MSPAMEHRERSRRRSPDQSDAPIMDRHSSRRRSSPQRERSPTRRRSSPQRERSPTRRRSPPQRERSPTRRRSSPQREMSPTRRRSSPQRERSPTRRRSSPSMRSPKRTSSSHRIRSHVKEMLPDRTRSPKQARPRSPARISSSSLSPRSKRLRRVQAEREADRLPEKERRRDSSKEERDERRYKEHDEGGDVPSERRSAREKDDGGSPRLSRRVPAVSPTERGLRGRYSSRSPLGASMAGGREEATDTREAEETWIGDRDSVAKMKAAEEALENKEKQKPSFELSGKLAEETNRVRGVTLLFNEPADARKPDIRWRLYVFKAGEVLNEPLYVHRQSCYLFGRERRIADVPTDHPSCSKQHAVLQFRIVENEQPDGLLPKQVRPYLMDLGSTNGTFINDNRIEPQRYYELLEKDTIRFGNSSREYVLLHEQSAT